MIKKITVTLLSNLWTKIYFNLPHKWERNIKINHFDTSFRQPKSTVEKFPNPVIPYTLVFTFNPHFHEWPRQNFSSQYQYNINKISDGNKEKYQFGDK